MHELPARPQPEASFAGSPRITTADFSIVIPTCNEIDNLSKLIRRIASALVDVAWEIIIATRLYLTPLLGRFFRAGTGERGAYANHETEL